MKYAYQDIVYLVCELVLPCLMTPIFIQFLIQSHFLKSISSRFNFRIGILYLPFLSQLSVTNISLLSKPLSDLPITMLNPKFDASAQIHWRTWSQASISYSFLNWLQTSTLTLITNIYLDINMYDIRRHNTLEDNIRVHHI